MESKLLLTRMSLHFTHWPNWRAFLTGSKAAPLWALSRAEQSLLLLPSLWNEAPSIIAILLALAGGPTGGRGKAREEGWFLGASRNLRILPSASSQVMTPLTIPWALSIYWGSSTHASITIQSFSFILGKTDTPKIVGSVHRTLANSGQKALCWRMFCHCCSLCVLSKAREGFFLWFCAIRPLLSNIFLLWIREF